MTSVHVTHNECPMQIGNQGGTAEAFVPRDEKLRGFLLQILGIRRYGRISLDTENLIIHHEKGVYYERKIGTDQGEGHSRD